MASNRTFRDLKGVVEEIEILENSVPKSTRSVNKWAMNLFWRVVGGKKQIRKPVEESRSATETSQIQSFWKGIFVA